MAITMIIAVTRNTSPHACLEVSFIKISIKHSRDNIEIMNIVCGQAKKVLKWVKSNKVSILIYSAISLIFFGTFIKLDFATDTYAFMYNSVDDFLGTFLGNGRIIAGVFGTLFKLIPGVSIQVVCLFSFLVGIISLILSLCVLDGLVNKVIRNNVLCKLITTLIIINPFIIELFLFIEKGAMLLGVLFCVLAAKNFVRYLEEKDNNKKSIKFLIYSIAMMIMGSISYQGVLGIYILIATVFTIYYSKNFKQFVINTILSVVPYIGGMITNFLWIKLISVDGRTSGSLNIVGSIKAITANWDWMLRMFDIVPFKPIVVALGLIIVTTVVVMIRKRKAPLKFALLMGSILYVLLIAILAAVVPQIAMGTKVWLVPRSTYVYGAIIGIIPLTCLSYVSDELLAIKWKLPRYLISTTLLLMVIVLFYRHNQIIIDHYSVIAQDRTRAKVIGRMIDDYENESGNRVTRAAMIGDSVPNEAYPGILNIMDINDTSFSTFWSGINSIKYWNGRNDLQRVQAPEELKKYCRNNDWDYFDGSQVIFNKDFVGVCSYNSFEPHDSDK